MANTVFFDLELRNRLSKQLEKVFPDAKRIFGGVDSVVDKTKRKLDNLGGTEFKVRVDTSEVDKAGRKLDDLNRRVSSGSSVGLSTIAGGAFLGGIASNAVSTLMGSAMDFGKDVLKGGMQQGATKMQFNVLAGDKEGGALYGELRKYVKDSIFGPELYDNAKQMMAFGIAAKDVMPDIKMLGDVAMGDKGRMDQLTLAFSQTTSAGKLMGQDLLQYVAAGFNPLQEISKKTGKSMADLRDDMSNGLISATQVREAFVQATSEGGKFHGMLDKMSKTAFGKWQAMTGSWQDAKMALGQSLEGPMNRILDKMKVFVDDLPALMDRISPIATRIFDRVEEFWPSVQRFMGSAVELLKPVAGVLLSDGMARLGRSVMNIASTMEELLLPVVKGFAAGLQSLLDLIPEIGKKKNKGGPVQTMPFVWEDVQLPALADTARMKKIEDSIGFKNLNKNVVFLRGQAALDSFNQATLKDWKKGRVDDEIRLRTPAMMQGVAKTEASASEKAAAAAGDASGSILNGGPKVVNINMNAPMYQVQRQEFHTIQDAIKDLEPRVEEALARILRMVPA